MSFKTVCLEIIEPLQMGVVRPCSHNMTVINKTKFLSDADFLIWPKSSY